MKLPAPMSLVQIARFIDGEVQGPADMVFDSIVTSPMAANEFDLVFIFDKGSFNDKTNSSCGEDNCIFIFLHANTHCLYAVESKKRL